MQLYILQLLLWGCCTFSLLYAAPTPTAGERNNRPKEDVDDMFKFDPNEGAAFFADDGYRFELVEKQLIRGREVAKWRQTFQNIPIWDRQAVAERADRTQSWRRNFFDTALPIDGARARQILKFRARARFVDPFLIALKHFGDSNSDAHTITREQFWLPLDNGTLLFATQVSYEVPTECRECFVADGDVLQSWSCRRSIDYGGNTKTGRYQYGVKYPALTRTVVEGDCNALVDIMEVVNLEGSTWNDPNRPTKPHAYNCDSGNTDTIEDAFSPINDAFGFGTLTFKMLKDWWNIPMSKIKSVNYPRITLFVHGQRDGNVASWSNGRAVFSDEGADSRFFPTASCPDVVAHEIAHGVTGAYSKLVAIGQPGCLDESFSDVIGAAFNFYISQTTPWTIAAECMRNASALRWFDDPTKDTQSIKHFNQLTSGMNSHYCSGITNHLFYLMVTKLKWSLTDAATVFVTANQLFWSSNTELERGFCGLRDSVVVLFPAARAREFDSIAGDVGLGQSPCGQTPTVLTNCVEIKIDSLAAGNRELYSLKISKYLEPFGLLEVTTRGQDRFAHTVNIAIRRGDYPSGSSNDGVSNGPGMTQYVVVSTPNPGNWYLAITAKDSTAVNTFVKMCHSLLKYKTIPNGATELIEEMVSDSRQYFVFSSGEAAGSPVVIEVGATPESNPLTDINIYLGYPCQVPGEKSDRHWKKDDSRGPRKEIITTLEPNKNYILLVSAFLYSTKVAVKMVISGVKTGHYKYTCESALVTKEPGIIPNLDEIHLAPSTTVSLQFVAVSFIFLFE